ncbi:MAG: c-type cytochrome [Acidiferrobacterales bacterium]|nr:c-type cytochrome [Acidiferrobacterales bacterium]
MKNVVGLAVTASMLACTVAYAAGDTAAGEAKSAACAACHGPDGNSVNPEWPKLAGQHPAYLVEQLRAFKAGHRQNATMAPMAKNLSEQDMQDLAAYFASQPLKLTGAADAKLAQQGERLYRGGIAKRQVAACMGCHGPSGQGIPPRFPRLSGQHAAYTTQQLLAFKAGHRPSAADIMTTIAFRLSEQEINALAEYLSGLH